MSLIFAFALLIYLSFSLKGTTLVLRIADNAKYIIIVIFYPVELIIFGIKITGFKN